MKKLFAIATSAACLSFVNPLLANDAHHPDQGQTSTANAPAAKAPPKPSNPLLRQACDYASHPGRHDGRANEKDAGHARQNDGRQNPEERQKLMDEHMKVMQDGMAMMKGKGGMGCGMMGKKDKSASMPDRHDMMEKRMEMMEMMMQMMMDRQSANACRCRSKPSATRNSST